ncbi:MAG TPA: PAAR domain-containing protein [Pseudonocardiaceae bacterium]
MGTPAAVMGDKITATCNGHQIPNPASGAPQPAPPMPFSAPLTQGLASTVTIGGKFAAVAGSNGLNTPPHVGLHASDPFMAPNTQQGTVAAGSGTVMFDGKPAAKTGVSCTVCMGQPGQLAGSAADVLIGG